MTQIGKAAPKFELPANNGGTVAIPSGTPTVIYFYPKDDTPGCTNEAKDFTLHKEAFSDLGVGIVGISPDPVSRHEKFATKHDLDIVLASDEDTQVAQAFSVWVEKNMYGKTYMGIERSTFLIDGDGLIVEAWRKVRVKGHVETVLEAARRHFG